MKKLVFVLLFLTQVNFIMAESSTSKKVVLVLGSGGNRGLAHVGVIEELENLGIVPDMIVGCSAGAIIGALYAQHQDIAKVKEILIDLTSDDLVDFSLFQKYAISSRKKIEKFLDQHLEVKDFDSLKIPFIAVVTDLDKGEPIYLQEGELLPAVLASAALPGLFPPYKMNNVIYVDGGVSDPLPIAFAKSLEDSIVIASDISPSVDGFEADDLPSVMRKSFEVLYQRLAHVDQKKADILLEMSFDGEEVSSPIGDGLNQHIYERGKEVVQSSSEEILKKFNKAAVPGE